MSTGQTGAEILVDTLVAAGVRCIFTVSGNQILSVYDATIGQDIQLVHTRHEAAAVHMADAWGRITGQVGVALVTAGPGHLNALSALYTAMMAESPLLLLSGSPPIPQLGKGAFQEVDQVRCAQPVTKAAWLLEHPNTVRAHVEKACALASRGRPGPVHLSLPSDVLEAQLTDAVESSTVSWTVTTPLVADTMIGEALDLLEKARRPLILAGPATGRRRAEITPFTEFTHIPALVMESPRGISDPSLHAAVPCLREADVVLLLGKRLDFSLRFGQSPPFSPECRFIRVDAERPSPHEHVALEIVGDPLMVLRQLMKAAHQRAWPGSSWAAQVESARRSVPADWVELRRSSRLPIHPLRVCASLRPHLGANTILISDGGEFGQWIQADTEAVEWIINGPSGAIGGSLPMALGAKLAKPDSQIIVALGDGAFGYHALEFDTAVRYRLPFLAIVGNDARWNAEYQLQVQRYGVGRTVGCALQRSRYDKLAEALGGYGELVERPEDIAAALERGIRSGLPACVNVTIDAVPAPVFDVR